MDLRPCHIRDVDDLCRRHHGYGRSGNVATYAFAVYENDIIVAAFSWQPPPPGAAKSVCPEAPYAVLSLSRMVAVPKTDRVLKHISKPLMTQMRRLIDRGRWPVLVTYSDEGQGHTGYVYKCSGWTPTLRAQRKTVTIDGRRHSPYNNGVTVSHTNAIVGKTIIQRWEHRACPPGTTDIWLSVNGWERVPIPCRWASGNQAYTLRKKT